MSNTGKLMRYAELCNDEYGEMCIALCNLYNQSLISGDLKKILAEEIKINLDYFREHCKIRKRTTENIVYYKELIWHSY